MYLINRGLWINLTWIFSFKKLAARDREIKKENTGNMVEFPLDSKIVLNYAMEAADGGRKVSVTDERQFTITGHDPDPILTNILQMSVEVSPEDYHKA